MLLPGRARLHDPIQKNCRYTVKKQDLIKLALLMKKKVHTKNTSTKLPIIDYSISNQRQIPHYTSNPFRDTFSPKPHLPRTLSRPIKQRTANQGAVRHPNHMSKRSLLLTIPLDSKIIRKSRNEPRSNTSSHSFAVAPVARESQHCQAFFEITRCESEDQAALGLCGFGRFLGSGVGFEFGVFRSAGGAGDGQTEACGEGGGVGEAGEPEDADFCDADEDGEAFGGWGEVGEEGARCGCHCCGLLARGWLLVMRLMR
jgi:hypothetical protein